jgi:7-cyano-7-deazaguanine reductase
MNAQNPETQPELEPEPELEFFDNPAPQRDYVIQHIAEEFTSMCPKTGHPDYATVVLTYVPDQVCVELKSYKLYLHAFRNRGIFYEAVTNRILEDLRSACNPRWIRIETLWTGRGGIRSNLTAEYRAPDYQGQVPPGYPG